MAIGTTGGTRDRPPMLPFVIAVGVTGHRQTALPADAGDAIKQQIRSVLAEVKAQALSVQSTSSEFFSAAPARLILHSALADGTDQIAAGIALELGFELHAILPFEAEQYRLDMVDDAARDRLDHLLRQAASVLELPRGPDDALEPYVMAGLAIVAHSDLITAVWDGLPARGAGGTAHIVQFASEMARPIVHLTPGNPETAIRWGAFDPAFVTAWDDPAMIRSYSTEQLRGVLEALVAPPKDERERQFLREFQSERRRRWRLRMEYPLLLAAAGVSKIKRHHFRTDRSIADTFEEWSRYRDACFRAEAVSVPLELLRAWYEWADSLAGHFAQSYRSGHVFNFVLGAFAVLLGVSNLVLPAWSVYLETALFIVVLAILLNTVAGNRQQWHRRWLDYRQLAERLRPMRTLKLMAVAAPDPPGTRADPVARRWVEWYAARVWRAIGAPAGRIDGARLEKLSSTIVDNEIMPQVAYHRAAARQVLRLDRRLGIISFTAFVLALCSSIVLLTGFAIAPDWVDRNYDWFTVLAAGLPAIGTAAVGIRVQGDHSGGAARSERSAEILEQIGTRLKAERTSLKRAADLTEQSARAMLGDLDEWQLLNQQHELSVG
jgi:hypothetical protein